MEQELQWHDLGTKAQTPNGLLGSWQLMPKQQGMVAQVVEEQHLHSKHSSNGVISFLLHTLYSIPTSTGHISSAFSPVPSPWPLVVTRIVASKPKKITLCKLDSILLPVALERLGDTKICVVDKKRHGLVGHSTRFYKSNPIVFAIKKVENL